MSSNLDSGRESNRLQAVEVGYHYKYGACLHLPERGFFLYGVFDFTDRFFWMRIDSYPGGVHEQALEYIKRVFAL
jgi:hypothetical protein